MEPPGKAWTDGPDARMLCDEYWFALDEWQGILLDSWLARDADGRMLVITAGLSVPRQNGKTGAIEALEFYLLVTDPGAHILHTAHRVKTAKKAHRRLAAIFTKPGSKWAPIRDLVARVRWTNGEEAIEMKSGATIEYCARTNGGGRGFDNITLVVYDEAQQLTQDQYDSINATMAASETGDRQAIYCGTPPGPNVPGDVFRRRREAALSHPTPHTSWHEWSCEECPPADAAWEDVADLVYQTNPGMELGRPSSLSEVFTREEFAGCDGAMDSFARERLGWWSEVAEAARAIERRLWSKSGIEAIGDAYAGRMAFGLKFSPDGASYALAGCKLDASGNAAVELVEVGDTSGGTRPLAEALLERKGRASCVVVDGQAGAGALCENMSGAPRGYVVRPKPADVALAASMLLDGLREGTLSHTTRGQEALDASALGSVRRPIGRSGAWGFGSTETDDSTPVEAASLALWGARTSRRDPRRRQMIL